jgi:hypothetical protein
MVSFLETLCDRERVDEVMAMMNEVLANIKKGLQCAG